MTPQNKTLGDTGLLPEKRNPVVGIAFGEGFNQAIKEISKIPLSSLIEKVGWDEEKVKELIYKVAKENEQIDKFGDIELRYECDDVGLLASALISKLKECMK